ncbi:btk-binding protein-related [Anaeramoeba flamelloides]|uniref:Btk-binding protein-related n=1 Tax=Anaeramoeba flamelloides TaxID=1746091 RepID=A0AAV7Y4A4_9EUKA|nr:btk-binding protein-related [Anaeramoeba flamelloides]
MESLIYVGGQKESIQFLFDPLDSNLPKMTQVSNEQIQNQREIKKIVSGNRQNFLLWRNNNTLEFYRNDKPMKQFSIKNEIVKGIYSGYTTYLILTESGNVFSLSEKTAYHEVPLDDPENSTFDEIRPIPFFNEEENNRKVQSIAMSGWSSYYVCKDGTMYGNGFNKGRLGDGTKNAHQSKPVIIYKSVSRIFSGVQGYCVFIITTDDNILGCGSNRCGRLGIGNTKDCSSPINVPKLDLKGSDILDISCACEHTVILTNEGKTFSTGQSSDYNGTGTSALYFNEISAFKDKKIIKIDTGTYITLALTSQNELYGWGFSTEEFYSRNEFKTKQKNGKWILPIKINLPQVFQNNSLPLNFSCATRKYFLYMDLNSCLKEDFRNLFESKKYYDSIISLSNEKESNNEIKIHKMLVELRTKLKIDQIQKVLNENNINTEELKLFLKWIYFDEINNSNALKKIFNFLNLSYPPENGLEKDLSRLFNDEDSKDFKILIKEDEEYEEEGGEDEEAFEEIPVHKIILLARSGLFREMFENINEKDKKINQIKDYSGKSFESLELLIKYFYTDKIELTADDDPELIFEELNDSIEYYLLNKNSNFNTELNKCKTFN